MTTTAARTVLSDSGVIAECAHFYCCCRGDSSARARGWIREQIVTRAALEAWECGAVADDATLADLLRKARYASKRFRASVKLVRAGKRAETDGVHVRADRAAGFALRALGTHVLDRVAFSGLELKCHLHPESGTWSFPREVAG